MSNRIFAVLVATALATSPAVAQPSAEPPAEQAPALSGDYLVGSWIPTDVDNRCGTITAIEFRRDGTWSTFGRGGTYSASGNRITLRASGERTNEHLVTIIGRNLYRVQIVGAGPAFEMRRCNPEAGGGRKGG